MSKTIEFYFDYSSPYGYLASERIESIAQANEHQVLWRPILLGAVFKVTGQGPLIETPLKGAYAMIDFARTAREHNLEYKHPEQFPVGAVGASRATLWIRDNPDETIRTLTGAFMHNVYRAYFAQGKDITNPDILAALASATGLDAQNMLSAISQQNIKDALRSETEAAIAAGVFGSPMMIVDGERFWGHDRLEQLDKWLRQDGW